MEQQQVMEEGNKIISDFMELETESVDGVLWHRVEKSGIHPYSIKVEYHSSWDWLKPVIDEIFTYSLAHPEQVDKIRKISIVVDIMPCWEKCVEFIKWLNNYQSQTK